MPASTAHRGRATVAGLASTRNGDRHLATAHILYDPRAPARSQSPFRVDAADVSTGLLSRAICHSRQAQAIRSTSRAVHAGTYQTKSNMAWVRLAARLAEIPPAQSMMRRAASRRLGTGVGGPGRGPSGAIRHFAGEATGGLSAASAAARSPPAHQTTQHPMPHISRRMPMTPVSRNTWRGLFSACVYSVSPQPGK